MKILLLVKTVLNGFSRRWTSGKGNVKQGTRNKERGKGTGNVRREPGKGTRNKDREQKQGTGKSGERPARAEEWQPTRD
jgi:hypothetical protein